MGSEDHVTPIGMVGWARQWVQKTMLRLLGMVGWARQWVQKTMLRLLERWDEPANGFRRPCYAYWNGGMSPPMGSEDNVTPIGMVGWARQWVQKTMLRLLEWWDEPANGFRRPMLRPWNGGMSPPMGSEDHVTPIGMVGWARQWVQKTMLRLLEWWDEPANGFRRPCYAYWNGGMSPPMGSEDHVTPIGMVGWARQWVQKTMLRLLEWWDEPANGFRRPCYAYWNGGMSPPMGSEDHVTPIGMVGWARQWVQKTMLRLLEWWDEPANGFRRPCYAYWNGGMSPPLGSEDHVTPIGMVGWARQWVQKTMLRLLEWWDEPANGFRRPCYAYWNGGMSPPMVSEDHVTPIGMAGEPANGSRRPCYAYWNGGMSPPMGPGLHSAWDISQASWDMGTVRYFQIWDKLRYFLDKLRYWHREIFSNLRQVEIFLRQGEILVPWDIFKHETSWDIS